MAQQPKVFRAHPQGIVGGLLAVPLHDDKPTGLLISPRVISMLGDGTIEQVGQHDACPDEIMTHLNAGRIRSHASCQLFQLAAIDGVGHCGWSISSGPVTNGHRHVSTDEQSKNG